MGTFFQVRDTVLYLKAGFLGSRTEEVWEEEGGWVKEEHYKESMNPPEKETQKNEEIFENEWKYKENFDPPHLQLLSLCMHKDDPDWTEDFWKFWDTDKVTL